MTTTNIGSSAEVVDFATVKATTRPAPGKFEKFRERWLRQLALDHELPAGALRLCLIVSTYLSRHSGHSWPGMTRLAKETGLSRRQIIRLAQLVEQRGHWTVIRTKVGPKNFVNHYIPTCATVHQGSDIASSLGSDTAMSLGGGDIATSPEPLKREPLSEPLNEPLPNGRDYIAANRNAEVGNTQSKG